MYCQRAKSGPMAIPIRNQEKASCIIGFYYSGTQKAIASKDKAKYKTVMMRQRWLTVPVAKHLRVRGMVHRVHGTLPIWHLPGRLCGTWVDTAACGRGAVWGGLECKPARRPERNRRGENKTHTLKTEQKSSLGDLEPQATCGSVWSKTAILGTKQLPEAGDVPMVTPNTYRTQQGTQHRKRQETRTYCG